MKFKKPSTTVVVTCLLVAFMLLLPVVLLGSSTPTAVADSTMTESKLYTTLRDDPKSIAFLVFDDAVVHVYSTETAFVDVNVPDEGSRTELKKLANEKSVTYTNKAAEKPSAMLGLIAMFAPILIMVVLIVVAMRFMNRQSGGMNKQLEFGKHKGKKFSPATGRIFFSDVTGQYEGKEELQEVVQFLKEPDLFTQQGAKIPRGVLLIGPPGTGKTLLSRAVAGEAGVPFFSISGSEFVEMFVGVGASRVRSLFEQVKLNAPAIVFIDEIDAVGRQRGAGLGGSNDEREQTLNQILVEMDGFEQSSAPVIVIAATNRPDVLDPALLRPGRFTRQVVVDLPDQAGRVATIHLYSKDKPLAADVDVEFFARAMHGFSQADIANVMNEAAVLSARRKMTGIFSGKLQKSDAVQITAEDIDAAISKQQFGPERKSMKLSDEHKENVGIHESGHAVAHWKMSGGDTPRKITIVPTAKAAGYVQLLTKANQMTQTRDECITFIVMALAGRTAQMKLLKRADSGASNDFNQAWDIARRMVAEWGMSDLGVIYAPIAEDHPFLGRQVGHAPAVSQRLMEKIEDEVQKILSECQKQADEIIGTYGDAIIQVKDILLARETILGPEFVQIMESVTVTESAA